MTLAKSAADDDVCSICLDPFVDKARLDGCGHTFCRQCILVWSQTTNKCTLCQAKFRRIELVEQSDESRRKTRSRGPPDITKVKPLKQRATWDDDELQRLLEAAAAASADDDAADDDNNNDQAAENGAAAAAASSDDPDGDGVAVWQDEESDTEDAYDLTDGLVVGDDESIEYADDATSSSDTEEDAEEEEEDEEESESDDVEIIQPSKRRK